MVKLGKVRLLLESSAASLARAEVYRRGMLSKGVWIDDRAYDACEAGWRH